MPNVIVAEDTIVDDVQPRKLQQQWEHQHQQQQQQQRHNGYCNSIFSFLPIIPEHEALCCEDVRNISKSSDNSAGRRSHTTTAAAAISHNNNKAAMMTVVWVAILRNHVLLLDIGDQHVEEAVMDTAAGLLELDPVIGWDTYTLSPPPATSTAATATATATATTSTSSTTNADAASTSTTTNADAASTTSAWKGLRFHVYDDTLTAAADHDAYCSNDETNDETNDVTVWTFLCVFNNNSSSSSSRAKDDNGSSNNSSNRVQRAAQRFVLQHMVHLTEPFRASDRTWRRGGTHACQFLFAPVLQQRMERMHHHLEQQEPPAAAAAAATATVSSSSSARKQMRSSSNTDEEEEDEGEEEENEDPALDIIKRNRCIVEAQIRKYEEREAAAATEESEGAAIIVSMDYDDDSDDDDCDDNNEAQRPLLMPDLEPTDEHDDDDYYDDDASSSSNSSHSNGEYEAHCMAASDWKSSKKGPNESDDSFVEEEDDDEMAYLEAAASKSVWKMVHSPDRAYFGVKVGKVGVQDLGGDTRENDETQEQLQIAQVQEDRFIDCRRPGTLASELEAVAARTFVPMLRQEEEEANSQLVRMSTTTNQKLDSAMERFGLISEGRIESSASSPDQANSPENSSTSMLSKTPVSPLGVSYLLHEEDKLDEIIPVIHQVNEMPSGVWESPHKYDKPKDATMALGYYSTDALLLREPIETSLVTPGSAAAAAAVVSLLALPALDAAPRREASKSSGGSIAADQFQSRTQGESSNVVNGKPPLDESPISVADVCACRSSPDTVHVTRALVLFDSPKPSPVVQSHEVLCFDLPTVFESARLESPEPSHAKGEVQGETSDAIIGVPLEVALDLPMEFAKSDDDGTLADAPEPFDANDAAVLIESSKYTPGESSSKKQPVDNSPLGVAELSGNFPMLPGVTAPNVDKTKEARRLEDDESPESNDGRMCFWCTLFAPRKSALV